MLRVVGRMKVHSGEVRQHMMTPVSQPYGVRMLSQRAKHRSYGRATNTDQALGSHPSDLELAVGKGLDKTHYGAAVTYVPEAHRRLEAHSTPLVFQGFKKCRHRPRTVRDQSPTGSLSRYSVTVAQLHHHTFNSRGTGDRFGPCRGAPSEQPSYQAHESTERGKSGEMTRSMPPIIGSDFSRVHTRPESGTSPHSPRVGL